MNFLRCKQGNGGVWRAGLYIGLLVASLVSLFVWRTNRGTSLLYRDVANALLKQYPLVVNGSQNLGILALKSRHTQKFELTFLRTSDRKVILSDVSPNTQLSITWRPNNDMVVYQEADGGDRIYSLCTLDLSSGIKRTLRLPTSVSAAPPLRWNRQGSRLAYCQMNAFSGSRLHIVDFQFSEPRLLFTVDDVDSDSDYSWSASGSELICMSESRLGHAIRVDTKLRHTITFPLVTTGQIKHLALHPSGKILLFTWRAPGWEYFRLMRTDLNGKSVEQITQVEGDVSFPIWEPTGNSFIFHVSRKGETTVWWESADGSASAALGAADGVNLCQGFVDHEPSVRILQKSNTRTPCLIKASYPTNKIELLYAKPSFDGESICSPEFTEIEAPDGMRIPALLWRAGSTGRHVPRPLLIDIHGGPGVQISSEWDAARARVLNDGFNVLSINYRGSTGYGATFERLWEEAPQVLDIVAACDFAISELHTPSNGIVLMGSSYGSKLALGAYALRPEAIGALVLVSLSEVPFVSSRPIRFPPFGVVGFHGENDHVISSAVARSHLKAWLDLSHYASGGFQWRTFPTEGHHFHKTDSWTQVYVEVLNCLRAVMSRTRQDDGMLN